MILYLFSPYIRDFIVSGLWRSLLFLSAVFCTSQCSLEVFTHPKLCLAYTRHPLFYDKGLFITPTLIKLPELGCSDEYVLRLKRLIEYLSSPSQSVPASVHVSEPVRRKRLAFVPVLVGLASVLSTIAMGSGISNAVDIHGLTDAVSFITENQKRINFELNELTASVLELQTAHHNSFLALKQSVDLVKLQAEYNSCQVGLNRLDAVVQSILARSLTSHIIPPADISAFLNTNEVLRNSIYTSFPRLVYQLGSIELVNVDPDHQAFTVLILLPHLDRESDGYLFVPIYAPRFSLKGNRTQIEVSPPISALASPKADLDRLATSDLSGIDSSKCNIFNMAAICPMSATYYNPSSICSASLLMNATDADTLSNRCDLVTRDIDRRQLTNIAESPTALILFTNEETIGRTSAGKITLVPRGAPPSCVLLEKLQLSSLEVGGKRFLLNLRTDIFALSPETSSIARHLHSTLGDLALSNPSRALATAQLHPSSKHFPVSMIAVFLTAFVAFAAMFVVMMIGLKIVGVVRQIRALRRLGIGDPARSVGFLENQAATP